jgi:phosphatidylinositol alpha-1,6-mannosyltransferase
MGIPAITTHRGILPETVIDGETGHLVDEHPDALAAAMLDVWKNPDRWAVRGKAARHRVLARHTLEVQAERLDGFYRELIGES